MKQVAILGCGPSGLLCAHAAVQAGIEPLIFSRKEKSKIPGSQHLHGPVPDLTSPYPEGTIEFVRIGKAEDYALKVYGDPWRKTGWGNYRQIYPSWNVINAYDKLWGEFEGRIISQDVKPWFVNQLQDTCDLVISTVPAQVICYNQKHRFHGTDYTILTLPTPPDDAEHDIVVYNGLLSDPWYRWSILGGLCSIEYSKPPPPMSYIDIIWGRKAIDNDCDCFPWVQRCGRWAEWRHGVTMYSAYQKAVRLLKGL